MDVWGSGLCICSDMVECTAKCTWSCSLIALSLHSILISHCIFAYRRRVRGDPYYELMDEFLTAVKRRYGNTVLLQFEGMAYENASRLLNMYRWGLEEVCGQEEVWGPEGVSC